MKYFFSFLLFLLFLNPLKAQSFIEAKVLNSITSEPIPYVNIGIIELRKGTVSSFEGDFKLAYNSASDSVTFSSIGYKARRISINDLIKIPNVYMEPQIIVGEEIRVEAESLGKLKVFGYKLKNKGGSIGYGSTELGTEMGALIKFENRTLIESAHFAVNFTGSDSMRYRLNLYKVENGEVGENYLKENVLILGAQEKGTFSIDLDEYDVVVEGEVMLSLEYIEAINEEEKSGMMFRGKQVRGKRKANLYMKHTSLSPYEKVDMIYYQIGFYIMGRELGK
ncbi:MAG: carboxypeptidase-like regulatory domain-containing protein [Balneola sp.]